MSKLLSCQLCTGTWVGFAMAAVIPNQFQFTEWYWVDSILHGLLYRGFAHPLTILTNVATSAKRALDAGTLRIIQSKK